MWFQNNLCQSKLSVSKMHGLINISNFPNNIIIITCQCFLSYILQTKGNLKFQITEHIYISKRFVWVKLRKINNVHRNILVLTEKSMLMKKWFLSMCFCLLSMTKEIYRRRNSANLVPIRRRRVTMHLWLNFLMFW